MVLTMKRTVTLLSLLLFLLAPTFSLSERKMEGSLHAVESCIGEMSCASSALQCCPSNALLSFFVQEDSSLFTFIALQKNYYFQYHQQPLSGTSSRLYRPPII